MNHSRKNLCAAIMAAVLLAARGAFAQAADDNFQKMLTYEHGQSRLALTAIEDQLRKATPSEQAAIETKLIAALSEPTATRDAKEFVCRELRQIGSCKCVPAVSALLTDEKLSHMARYAMQGLPCPEVDTILLATLGKVSGNLKIGMLSSIGARGDRKAVPDIVKLISDPDKGIAGAALVAVGRIGGDKAAAALAKAQVPADLKNLRDDAYLKCADSLLAAGDAKAALAIYREMFADANPTIIRVGALRGIVLTEKEKAAPTVLAMLKGDNAVLQAAAGKLVADVPAPGLTKAVAAELPTLPANIQVLVLNALSARGDKSAAANVAKLAASEDESVRVAALEALGTLGDGTSVELLVKNVKAAGPTGAAAQSSLRKIRGAGVNEALLKFVKDPDAAVRAQIIGALAARQVTAAAPMLLEATQDADAGVRTESWKALGSLAAAKDLGAMVALLLKAQGGDQATAEQAVAAVCSRITDPNQRVQPIVAAMTGAGVPEKCSLLRVLGRAGGEKALAVVRAALTDANAEVQDAAARALTEWPDLGAANELLALAKNAAKPDQKILALRAYVRLASQAKSASPEDTAKRLTAALEVAPRADEKKLVIGALANLQSPAALRGIETAWADEAVRGEAEAAYLKVAQSLEKKHAAEAKKALQHFLELSKNDGLRAQATKALDGLK